MHRLLWMGIVLSGSLTAVAETAVELAIPRTELRLEGEVGRRIEAVLENWVLPMPDANPAVLEMFRLRDRDPAYKTPVPWAGEFIGKYLQSAIQFIQFTDDPALKKQVGAVIAELLSTQSPDGYLGPFRKEERLLGQWDLWGHYHVLYALHAWYTLTGDQAALEGATRAADLICDTYLDAERRVYDAGSLEMNMAIMHALGILYRETGKERYYQLMKEIEKDWEKPPAGDYLRTALNKVPFYKTPKPRWESLHCMQGLGELYRISGEEKYREALLHHWRSIHATDIHNAGSFSTGEGAVGNPFKPGAIETCCTVAWIAYSVDALRLSADSIIADAIERSTLNTVLGYEHPSGRWATYNTPMDGKRQASAHTIVFQSREGTPELNCCSVNAARGLSMIADWGVLTGEDGLYLNYYGPGKLQAETKALGTWTFVQETAYPAVGTISIQVRPGTEVETTLYLRIPAWSAKSQVSVNGDLLAAAIPGQYLPVRRTWKDGDVIEVNLDMSIRPLSGDGYVDFNTSLFQGPLLLAYDQKHNALDPADVPEMDLKTLRPKPATPDARFQPMVLLEMNTVGGDPLFLIDYATAGAHGTYYRSWLPVRNTPPVAFHQLRPNDGYAQAPDDVYLLWSGAGRDARYAVRIAKDPGMEEVISTVSDLEGTAHFFTPPAQGKATYYWNVTARNGDYQTQSASSPWAFTLDPDAPPAEAALILNAPLHGKSAAIVGALAVNEHAKSAAGRDGRDNTALAFDGKETKLVYEIGPFPVRDYSLSAWFAPDNLAKNDSDWHHIFSAWSKGSDDPLRVSVQNRRLVVNIEQASGGYHCPGPKLIEGEWTHITVVKQATQLRLYVNGALLHETNVSEELQTSATNIGLGCNPNLTKLEGYEG
ncbi:MAG: glycoside hydrolase family 127 protein, partial [Candidatus Hydrogenedentes bacterium]|nr:glycoside hydrolase family 127 protein [Candidatus Hydrogenedentota bacterium]